MINSVCLIGNLAADPEIRSTPRGTKIAKMRIAVNEFWTDNQTGERVKRTHWFSLNAWDRMADTCERYLKKGMKIAVRGSLEYQEWSAQDGSKRSKIEVRVREMEMLSPRDGNRSGYSNESYGGQSGGDDYSAPDDAIEDDDIPF